MARLLCFASLLAPLMLVGSLTLGAAPAAAQETAPASPGDELYRQPARQGWFWYLDPKEKEREAPQPAPKPAPEPPKAESKQPVVVIGRPAKTDEEKKGEEAKAPVIIANLPPEERKAVCSQKDTWQADCGFIDPGADFEFQAKQRDNLLKMMSLTPENPKAVEAAQQYMKWVVGKASMAANMWYFNMVQNPDLDPTVKNPISEVGIALATRVTQASQVEYFKLIKDEGGVLFFFSRLDCSFCHDQAPYAKRVAHTMGLQLINIPLDGSCLEGFEGDNCGDNIRPEQAAVLDVKIVPAIYLFVPSNTWIRLGTGVVSDNKVLANAVNFFSAYRAALLNGLDNGDGVKPSVSFDPKLRPAASGAASASGHAPVGAPDQHTLMELMGYDENGNAPPP